MVANKMIDPIPKHFTSIEEASDFWDEHDAGDYEAYLRPLDETIELTKSLPQAVLLEPSLIQRLKQIAQQQGISLEKLVNVWLQEKLMVAGL
jgi:hypothetical protein